MTVRIDINEFGRIGRAVLRSALRGNGDVGLRVVPAHTDDPIVGSSDVRRTAHSALFDSFVGMALGSRFAKLIAWCVNETGHANRLPEWAYAVADKKSVCAL